VLLLSITVKCMAKKRKEKKQQSAVFRSLSKEKERMP
jgi:hypothetical protein